MDRIETVSPELRFLTNKIQQTPELNIFDLAGRTNLALRFDHRVSADIDLFTNKKIEINPSKDDTSCIETVKSIPKYSTHSN